MVKHILCALCMGLLLLSSQTANAAGGFEIGVHAGYTLTSGVDFANTIVGTETYNSVKPTDSASWGFTAGYRTWEGFGIGFLFDRQESSLEVSGPVVNKNLGDMHVDNYHGILTYDHTVSNPDVNTFLFFGLGATDFSDMTIAGRTVNGSSQFSTTWGGGIKVYPNQGSFGLRGIIRWTPTYVSSDPEGWWCDPYWGCTVYEDADYVHQVQFAGGISYRFGQH